jgi:ketosteroid isomerase-like protein
MSATATATSVQELDKQLNDDVLSGKALEAFEKYYADDVVMQENSEEPRRGKDVNRKFEHEFFGSVEAFNGGSVKASAVTGDVTFSEWEYDITFKGGQRVKLNQVAVRHWKNGKIVNERFYFNKG